MANRPYVTAAQVRRSVLRRRAVKAQLAAEAEAARRWRTKPAGERSEQVSTSTTNAGEA